MKSRQSDSTDDLTFSQRYGYQKTSQLSESKW